LHYEPIGNRLRQGDVYRDLSIVIDLREDDDEGTLSAVYSVLPYAVMLSQDCDLERDHLTRQAVGDTHDKHLPALLVCPAFPAGQVRDGKHLSEEKLTMQRFNSPQWHLLKTNANERYHYVAAGEDFQIPELVLDFKRYQTVRRDALVKSFSEGSGLATLVCPFRERLSQRFANYLSRIGLPEPPFKHTGPTEIPAT